MEAPTRRKLRLTGTVALAFVHVWFAGLAFFDRLSFTQPSEYAVLQYAADSVWWGWLFAATGVALVVLLILNPYKHNVAASRACSTSAAFIGVWSFFTLMWGLTTAYPVSLAVFGPAVFSVVGAQVLATAWNHKEQSTT
jgi:hypothetical protein